VPEWSTYEDRTVKRRGIEDRVSSRDIGSSSSKDLGDEFRTLWLLWSVATLEEDEAHRNGALIRREVGTHSNGALTRQKFVV
jgi:hypothetical protein